MEEATRQRLINEHLKKYPLDSNYLQLLLQNPEFVPSDKAYDAWFNYNLNGINRSKTIIKQIEEQVGPIAGFDVLDVGAGGGGCSIALSNHGCNVTAIEIDECRLAWLRTRISDYDLPINILHDPIEKIDFDKKYDLVICNAVLEHVDDWKLFLENLLDCTKKYLYLTWPNRYSIGEIISDQHYALFGASLLTGKLFPLQKYYTALFGIKRNAWVRAIPSLRAVRRLITEVTQDFSINHMMPVGVEKISDPSQINHPVAKRAITTLKRLGVSDNMIISLIISQRKGSEIIITLN